MNDNMNNGNSSSSNNRTEAYNRFNLSNNSNNLNINNNQIDNGLNVNTVPGLNNGNSVNNGLNVNTVTGLNNGNSVNNGLNVNTVPGLNNGNSVNNGLNANTVPGLNNGNSVNNGLNANTVPGLNNGNSVNNGLNVNTVPGLNNGNPVNSGLNANNVSGLNNGNPVNSGLNVNNVSGLNNNGFTKPTNVDPNSVVNNSINVSVPTASGFISDNLNSVNNSTKSVESMEEKTVIEEIEEKKYNLLTPQQKEALIEKRKQRQAEKDSYVYVPISTGKKVLSVLIIVILLSVVLFLPEINNFILNINFNNNSNNNQIVTGTLRCSLNKKDDKFNHSYNYSYAFTNNLLESMVYEKEIVGDSILNKEELTKKYNKCNLLKGYTDPIAGISVNCEFNENKYRLYQEFDYSNIDKKKLSTAFYEAGLVYPEFGYGTLIDDVEKKMNSSGFSCEKVK